MAKMNFDFGGLKEKLTDTISTVTDKVLDLADVAADTAKTGQQVAKLYLEKRKEEAALSSAYSELGKLYYDMHREEAEGVLADLCMEIENTLVNIEEIQTEIQAVKDASDCDFDDLEADAAPAEPVVTEIVPEEAPAEEVPVEEAPAEEAPADEEIEVAVEEYISEEDFVAPKKDEDIEVEIVEE